MTKARRDYTREVLASRRHIAFQGAGLISATKSRRARLPFPPTQLLDIYGYDFTYHLAAETYRALAKERFARPCPDSGQIFIHLPDVQGYLQEEIAAAYKVLSIPCNSDLWNFCSPELVEAIRGRDARKIRTVRQAFKTQIQMKLASDTVTHSTTAALAWATLVEAALLTDQLVLDMKEAAASKGCCKHREGWLSYFLPDPPPEARQAFNDYVRCRWPIHVFALDPVAQQQNIADVFSGRREMQLALSLGFVNGKISARKMMQYARRIEFDFATIDVNGTQVGLSHGDETFGWRFYPRFQTPDIESNLTVLTRDLIIGGTSRDALLRMRRLEPGMRECLAVVIMPSFVPYVTLNVSSDWFRLAHPKCKHVDAAYAMRLSTHVKAIQNCSAKVCDAENYRDGDLARLMHKAKQLEARLPLQSATVQIPYENTLGGFAMFNTGVTDLAPELTGWYGTPSINPKAATTVFLVGNHFSVHQTRVIAGGQEVATTEMLSRQVMKAAIPAGTTTVGDGCQTFVDIHLSTPYGVTTHMLVPVCAAAAAADAGGMAWDKASFDIAFAYGGLGITAPKDTTDPKNRPASLLLKRTADIAATFTSVDITLTFPKVYDDIKISLPGNALNAADKYEIAGDKLVTEIYKAFATKFGPEANNPPCPLSPTVTLTFKNAAGDVLAGDHQAKPLTITWVKGPSCCVK